MSDPAELTEALDDAEDAFAHAHGRPVFEPDINSGSDADAADVLLQKACRLLLAADCLQDEGEFYTSILEHAFAAIERTLEGYLVAFTGAEPSDFHDHEDTYRRARGQVPLTKGTLESLEALYAARRTGHYYGTTVTTERQASEMLTAARRLHSHVVGFDPDLERFCVCDGQ